MPVFTQGPGEKDMNAFPANGFRIVLSSRHFRTACPVSACPRPEAPFCYPPTNYRTRVWHHIRPRLNPPQPFQAPLLQMGVERIEDIKLGGPDWAVGSAVFELWVVLRAAQTQQLSPNGSISAPGWASQPTQPVFPTAARRASRE